MLSQIENTPCGYIVGLFIDDNSRWVRLRNFGERQGDAIAFREQDLPGLSDVQITALARNFDIKKRYKRIARNHYRLMED